MESCWGEENMKLVMVDMKKAIAKCSHEDAPELSLPPYRSAYRFTNTMINKGDDYEHINEMASMFAKMMHHMKNRNSFSPYSALRSPRTPLSPVRPSAPSSLARSRCSQSAVRRPR